MTFYASIMMQNNANYKIVLKDRGAHGPLWTSVSYATASMVAEA
jgi:hypothetical protein